LTLVLVLENQTVRINHMILENSLEFGLINPMGNHL